MRLVLDTNVLIAAFLTRGICAELLEHVVRRHEAITSEFLLKEFERTLPKFGVSRSEAAEARRLLAARFALVEPVDLGERVSRDATDDAVLATAVAGRCACLITGDRGLLDLKTYRTIVILPPNQFWKFEAEWRR
jgi:putative PIN family toxin of toxin-antitoxin system